MLVNILVIVGWILSLWGIAVAMMLTFRGLEVRGVNILWAVCGIVYIIWRVFPNFQF